MSTHKAALYQDDSMAWGLIEADALLALAKLPDACVDAVVTDPPYGIAFHDEAWDGSDIRRAAGTQGERLRAGEAFERWTQIWARECLRVLKPGGHLLAFSAPRMTHRLISGVEDAGLEIRDQLLWLNGQGIPKSRRLPDGQATTLKPAYEPILLARRPLRGTVLANLEAFGTGALNTEANRVHSTATAEGYWPANVTLSHAPGCTRVSCTEDCPASFLTDSQSRLFFCAKASRREREAGCELLPPRLVQVYTGKHHPARLARNTHPTVKPLALMRWLVRLITPADALVLDPFTGSGTTGIAAVLEGRRFLGIEREPEYVDIACARMTHWAHHPEAG
jgi:site-specific DNA-methyltransferase (adenine-specific)